VSASRRPRPAAAGGALARRLAPAAVIGAGAGGLGAVEGRAPVLAVLAAQAAASFVLAGVRRLSVAAWGTAAFTAPLSGVRVSALALGDVALIAAVALSALSSVTGRRPGGPPVQPGVVAGLAAIAAGGVVGTFFAARPATSLGGVATFVLGSAGPVAALALWAPSRRQLRCFAWLWLAGAVASALWAILLGPAAFGRRAGLATHPNHLGIICMLGTGLALGLVVSGARPARRLAVAALPVLLLALALSGSRAAVVGCASAVLAMTWLCRRLHLALRALVVACAFGATVLAGVVDVPEQSGLGRLAGGRSAAESDTARAEHLARSLERFRQHPLTGEGFEFAEEAHNIYLQVAVAAGPMGVLGLLLVARGVLGATRRGASAGPWPIGGDRALVAGLGAGYAGYLVVGAFQNLLWDRYLWLYVACALALAARLEDEAGTAAGARPRHLPASFPSAV